MPRNTKPSSTSSQEVSSNLEGYKALIVESINEILPSLIEATFAKLALKVELLEEENNVLRRRIESLEDEKYANDLEVCGVPHEEGEDLQKLSKTILSKLKMDEGNVNSGVVKAYRLSRQASLKSKYLSKIVIQLSSPHLRRVAYHIRIKNKVTAADLGFRDTQNRIIINERLRPELRSVYHRLLVLKREKKIHSLWTHNQQIFVKVSHKDQAEAVQNYDLFLASLEHSEV